MRGCALAWIPYPSPRAPSLCFGAATYEVSGIGPTLNGRNGGGDRYYTDGEIRISRLVAGCHATPVNAVALENPTLVNMKNYAWHSIAEMIGAGR